MFRTHNTETVDPGVDTVDPAELVPLSSLVGEGFADDLPFVRSARDAVEQLATRLSDDVVLDDIGRRCVPRSAARQLFTERVEADRRRREAERRREADAIELDARTRPRDGIPAGWRWVPDEEEA